MSEEAKLVLLEGIAAALERLAPQSPRAVGFSICHSAGKREIAPVSDGRC